MRYVLALAAGLLLTIPALAADPPGASIDLTKPLVTSSGKPMLDGSDEQAGDPTCAHCPVMTVGRALRNILVTAWPQEQPDPRTGTGGLTADQKWARWTLQTKLTSEQSVTLTSDEIDVLKRLLGYTPNIAIVGQLMPLLQPNARPPELK